MKIKSMFTVLNSIGTFIILLHSNGLSVQKSVLFSILVIHTILCIILLQIHHARLYVRLLLSSKRRHIFSLVVLKLMELLLLLLLLVLLVVMVLGGGGGDDGCAAAGVAAVLVCVY